MSTPQSFLMASQPTLLIGVGVALSGRALLTGPHPPGLGTALALRGFHHWFLRSYTFPSCLPDPSRLAVPTRPGVVGAAAALTCASRVGLPPASTACCDRPQVGLLPSHPDTRRLVAHNGLPVSSGIFLIRGHEPPIEMKQMEPETEAVLQDLLAKHPSLLAGGAVDTANPRRWVLIAQEMGVGSEQGGAARWAVDHLFIDQDAVPTLVEVKRSSDTRIRREVVGQLIEYAANGIVYWPVERIRERYNAECERKGKHPETFLRDELGTIDDVEGFWLRVKENLESGRVRMLFVGDVIPPELQRMVEFLNEQMSKAEVLAVELRHYAAGHTRTLVPTVFGVTAKVRQQRKVSDWSRERFSGEFLIRHGEVAGLAVERLVKWGDDYGLSLSADKSGLYLGLNWGKTLHWPIRIVLDGQVIVNFQALGRHAPFDKEALRKELLDRLKAVPGVHIVGSPLNAKLDMSLLDIENAKGLDSLKEVFD